MRYVIYGAGAIGGTIGGHLAESGHDVALIARGRHLEALRANGLTLQRPFDEVTVAVDAFGSPEEAEIDATRDVVITAVKTQDSSEVLDRLADVADASLPIVCAQNGVEAERQALRRFANVYAVCVVVPAGYDEPGVVRSYGAPKAGVLKIGRYPNGLDEMVRRVTGDLDAAGFTAIATSTPMLEKYSKLLINLHNALDALGDKAARSSLFAERARAEAYAVYEASGIDVASLEDDEKRREGIIQRHPIKGEPWSGGSSWQSLARATGSLETDYLNGEIVLLGRQYGVPTPVNEAIQREARSAALGKRPPGSMSLDELAAALDV